MSDRLRVFIAGLGRMGEILAGSMSKKHEVAVYDRDEGKGRLVAERTDSRFCSPPDFLPLADAVVLALPPSVTAPALESMRPLLRPDVVVVNIATTVCRDDLRPVLNGVGHLVGAKIVGHYREMRERPAILVDAETEKGRQAALLLFSDLGTVLPGDERVVQLINTAATREAFRAAVRIEELLREAGVDDTLINSAIRVVAAGSIKAYADGDIGPFARDLLKEIRQRP
ncbi:MAG: NAD(P)-binding domain-containing protein [Firmicutes bacterium]|nr:NAD(P)-binding domain-containing protein [Bacillota bacterium]